MKIGVISDTHGKIRSEVLEQLKGSNCIIHAGDIGKKEVLETLEEIAPVYSVVGNVDKGSWMKNIPYERYIDIDNVKIYVIHNINQINIDPQLENVDIVISGHSHKFSKKIINNIIYINPGSAGNRRFKLPITLAVIYIEKDRKDIEIRYL